jgi:hypothetical protein
MNIEGEHTRIRLEGRTPSTIIEALECNSETQVHRWTHGVDELTLSQLDSQD